jgi:hypothetical protein
MNFLSSIESHKLEMSGQKLKSREASHALQPSCLQDQSY